MRDENWTRSAMNRIHGGGSNAWENTYMRSGWAWDVRWVPFWHRFETRKCTLAVYHGNEIIIMPDLSKNAQTRMPLRDLSGSTVPPEGDTSVDGSWSGSRRRRPFHGRLCSPTFARFVLRSAFQRLPISPFLIRTRWQCLCWYSEVGVNP